VDRIDPGLDERASLPSVRLPPEHRVPGSHGRKVFARGSNVGEDEPRTGRAGETNGLTIEFLAPRSEDICYATSNRQAAVKAIAPKCDKLLVIGAPNSSNSLRLAEVAERSGAPARLIQRAADIDWDWLGTPMRVGITAGASAPEVLVREVVEALSGRFEVIEDIAEHEPERMTFKLPRELVA